MVEIIDGVLKRDNLTKKAMGGTELMANRLLSSFNKEVFNGFQIIFSRPNVIYDNKKVILYCHDLPNDPQISRLNDVEFQNKIDLFVFVSQYQRGLFCHKFNIPYFKTIVINNAIETFPRVNKSNEKIKFIYHTTPHRGLLFLYIIFDHLTKMFPDVEMELNVFSSFKIYGWKERDVPFKPLFSAIKKHKNMNYFGTVSNEIIRQKLLESHIFFYPCIWEETSCLALIEALSANCICVHSDIGALRETSCGLTKIFNFSEDKDFFVRSAKEAIIPIIKNLKMFQERQNALNVKSIIDNTYNLDVFRENWKTAFSMVNRHYIKFYCS